MNIASEKKVELGCSATKQSNHASKKQQFLFVPKIKERDIIVEDEDAFSLASQQSSVFFLRSAGSV